MMTPDMLEVSKANYNVTVDGRCIGLVCLFKLEDFWPRAKRASMMTPDMLEVSKANYNVTVDGRCIGLVCLFKLEDF